VRTGVLSAGGALVLRRSDLARVALRNKARQDQTRQDKTALLRQSRDAIRK
jgi:hypothetical protein